MAEVCRKLDGMPLAIELATARVPALAVEQVAERLEDSLKLLSGGARAAAPRHQTMRATLEWSRELLDEAEKKLFGRLSIFAGGWTLEAAEAVGKGDGIEEGDVLDLLSRLVDKSLVVAEAGSEGALRYRMLEPVRQYGLERLEASGEAQQTRERHAGHYLAFVERAERELTGPDHSLWLDRLETEHDNMRAALGWSLEGEETKLGLRLAGALARIIHEGLRKGNLLGYARVVRRLDHDEETPLWRMMPHTQPVLIPPPPSPWRPPSTAALSPPTAGCPG